MTGARTQFAESPYTKNIPSTPSLELRLSHCNVTQPVFTPFIMISEEENFLDLQRVTKLHKQQVVLKKNKPTSSSVPVSSPHTQLPEKVLLETGDKSGLLLNMTQQQQLLRYGYLEGSNIWFTGSQKDSRLLHQYHSHEAMYRKDHSKYKGETWELNDPICLSQNCFLTHYLLSISININAKIIPFAWLVAVLLVHPSILSLMIYFNKVILNRSDCTVTILL